MDSITLDLASPPDRERLVVQLMIGEEQFAEVNQEIDSLQVEVYGRRDGQPWIVDFEQLMSALTNARGRLVSIK